MFITVLHTVGAGASMLMLAVWQGTPAPASVMDDQPGRGTPGWTRAKEILEDALTLIVTACLIPAVILAIGAPLALLIRLLIEVAKRVS